MSNNTIDLKIKFSETGQNVIKNIIASIGNADDVVSQLTQNVDRATSAFKNAANEAFRLGQVRDLIQNICQGLKEVSAPAMDFELAMREMNTMAGKGEKEFGKMKKAVQELSHEIPLARDLLAKGLYQVISNGVPEENWLEFLEKSSRSAVGGLANLEKVVTVTSTIVKNYGLNWDAAGEIQDKIQETAKNGVTSFEQLADALPRVAGSAATLGVAIDELMSTFATLTGVSGNTAEVSTQLATVFTALIKPSQEAEKAAMKMGISFNAMSIKAAGGLMPFLQQLNTQIDVYAAKTGKLKEEISAELFGSAQALRALIPLTGELADKFVENTNAIATSSGAIDAAFKQIDTTAQASIQKFKNITSAFFNWSASITGTAIPILTFIAHGGSAITQIKALGGVIKSISFRKFTTGIATSSMALKTKAIALGVATKAAALYRAGLIKLTTTLHSARAATIAMQAALTLGLSLAIWGVVAGVNALLSGHNATNAAVGNSIKKNEEYKNTLVTTRTELLQITSEIKNFVGGQEEEAEKVEELNTKYGAAFGCYETISEWYDVLIAKSETYAQVIANEARIRELANRAVKADDAVEEVAKRPLLKFAPLSAAFNGGDAVSMAEQLKKEAIDKAREIAREAHKALEDEVKKNADLKKKLLDPLNGKEKAGNNPTIANTYDEIGKKIQEYQELLHGLDAADTAQIRTISLKIDALKKQQQAILDIADAATIPVELKTIEDVDKAIAYNQKLFTKASAEKRKEINNVVEKLIELKQTMTDGGYTPPSTESISTFKELEKAIGFYEKKIQTSTAEVRIEAQEQLNVLAKLKESWINSLAQINKPANTEQLNTIKELADAISYYENLQQRQSGAELLSTQKTINLLKKKHEALLNSLRLPALEDEANKLSKLSGTELLLNLKLLGLDDLKEKLKALKEMMKQPPGDMFSEEQRIAVNELIKKYEGFGAILQKNETKVSRTQDTFSGISSIMSSMSGIVDSSAAGWLQWGANLLSSISQAIPAILALVTTKKVEATANTEVAATGAASSVAGIPIVGPVLAVAAVASILAALANLPKFANGGLAYGPTLGIFGEYAGAANNPEVVAPLSKLRDLIQPVLPGSGEVTFKIEGRTLIGVLNKMQRIERRTK